jgi:hypothetical protein
MKSSLLSMFEFLFGCRHQHLSRVFTIRLRTYQVCIECGQEFEYPWESMRCKRRTVADRGYAPLSAVRDKA